MKTGVMTQNPGWPGYQHFWFYHWDLACIRFVTSHAETLALWWYQLSTSVKTISINSMPYNFHLKCMECPPLYISQCWIYRSPFWRGIIYLKTGWSILGFISRMFDCYCLSSLDNTKWDRLCYYCKTTRGVLNLCGGASPSRCPCKKDDP